MKRLRRRSVVAALALAIGASLAAGGPAAADFPSHVHLTTVVRGSPATSAVFPITLVCDGTLGRQTFYFTTSGDQDLNAEGSSRCAVQAPVVAGVSPAVRCSGTGESKCGGDASGTLGGGSYNLTFTVEYTFPNNGPGPPPTVSLPPAVPPEQNPPPETSARDAGAGGNQGNAGGAGGNGAGANGAGANGAGANGGSGAGSGGGGQSGATPSVPGATTSVGGSRDDTSTGGTVGAGADAGQRSGEKAAVEAANAAGPSGQPDGQAASGSGGRSAALIIGIVVLLGAAAVGATLWARRRPATAADEVSTDSGPDGDGHQGAPQPAAMSTDGSPSAD